MYGFNVQASGSFADAVARVTDALKAERFGVLTDVDVQRTMKEKLGVEGRLYRILGACNPPLAHRALTGDPDIGTASALQCRGAGGARQEPVGFMDPVAVLRLTDNADIAALAGEVRANFERVRDRPEPDPSAWTIEPSLGRPRVRSRRRRLRGPAAFLALVPRSREFPRLFPAVRSRTT